MSSKFHASIIMAIAVLALGASPAPGVEIVIQHGVDGYTGSEDVTVTQETQDTNNSLGVIGGVGHPGFGNWLDKTLIRWDLTHLASQVASVNSATLRLHTTTGSVTNDVEPYNLQMYDLPDSNGDWIEGTIADFSAPAPNGEPTWIAEVKGTSNWNPVITGLGNGGGTLIGQTPFGSAYNGVDSTIDIAFTDVSAIEDWINGVDNNGIMLMVDNNQGFPRQYRLFWNSNQASTASDRPELILNVTTAAAAIPEPSTITLLAGALVGLAVFARRRRR